MKYISLRSIFSRLPITEYQLDHVIMLEYASHALNLLQIPQTYEDKVCLLNIQDYTATLPKDLKYIQAVAYFYTDSVVRSPSKIVSTSTDITYTDEGKETVTTTIETANPVDNEHILERIQYQGVLNNYKLFLESDIFRNHFVYLKPTNASFTTVGCPDCPNLGSNHQYHYKITPYNQIQTLEIKNGYVCLCYLAIPKLGETRLIPDIEEIKQAIVSYIMMKYYEQLSVDDMNNQIVYRKYQETLVATERLMMRARGTMLSKSVDLDILTAIQERYINFARATKVFDNQ